MSPSDKASVGGNQNTPMNKPQCDKNWTSAWSRLLRARHCDDLQQRVPESRRSPEGATARPLGRRTFLEGRRKATVRTGSQVGAVAGMGALIGSVLPVAGTAVGFAVGLGVGALMMTPAGDGKTSETDLQISGNGDETELRKPGRTSSTASKDSSDDPFGNTPPWSNFWRHSLLCHRDLEYISWSAIAI